MKNTAMTRTSKASMASIGVCSMLALSGSLSMADEELHESFALEEIIVTAQRREENLQKVPIAVSAFSGEAARAADIHSIGDIATRVPSLTFSPFAPGQSIISLRGVSSNDDGAGTDNSVAVFLDDVYVGGLAAVAFDLFDLEAAEILRGPQGTLFGKNAIGGAINIRSIKPNTEESKGSVQATLGNYQQRDIRGYATGPLSDSFAGKLSFSKRENDGYVKNVLLNKRQKNEDVQSIRGQLLYFTDSFEALITAEHMQDNSEDMGRIPVTGISAAFDANGGDRDHVRNPIDGFSDRESTQFSVKLTQQFDAGELVSITAIRDFESTWNMDSVGEPFSIPGPILNSNGDDVSSLAGVNDDINEEVDALSQEFRWSSDLSGDFNYVAGFFYLQEETHRIEKFHLTAGLGRPADILDLAVDTSDQDNETTSYALFGQLTWNASENLTVNFGARYTYEEKELDNISIAGGFGIINNSFTASIKDDWSDFSPKISLDYALSDSTLVYASVAQGFKSGGFPAAPSRVEDFTSIDPEEATSYEIGMKADLMGSTLRINTSIYFMDYEALQVQRFGVDEGAPATDFGVFQTLNAGDAEVSGFELESTWLVTERFTLSGSYSYTNSEFVDTVLIDSQGNPLDVSGQDLNRAPKTKFSLTAEYTQPLSSGELKFRVDNRYTGENRQDIFADASRQPGFHVTDARVSWLSEGEKWGITAWGKNITDEEYIAHSYIVGPGVIAVYGNPRTYGLTGTYNF